MNSTLKKLAFCTLLGASGSAHAAPVLIPNGDFSLQEPAAGFFGKFESAPNVVSYPATGGSGDNGGYGLVNNTIGVWGGGLVSPKDKPDLQGIPLGDLGLIAGNTYTFSMDMKNFAGTGKGGLKLESWNGGTAAFNLTADMPASGSSASWVNYTWTYFIPVGATSIKIVPLATTASGVTTADSVGFDNIRVNNTPVPPPPFVPDTIPNGDFSMSPPGVNWAPEANGPVITFPTTNGNLGGNAVIDATVTEGFAAIKAFNGAEKTFASLGLTPGETCTIQLDMKILQGSNIGGVRLVGPAGYEFLSRPAIIGAGTEWATYSIPFTVPTESGRIQALFSFVWGFNSKVAFDNIKIVLPGPAQPLQATITPGAILNWTAASASNGYQPQTSSNGTTWTNLGPVIVGNTTTSIFDAPKAKFYQVLESTPIAEDAVYNGGFETEFVGGADGWESPPTQPSFWITTSGAARTGVACMELSVDTGPADPNNPAQPAPAQESQTSQNIANANADAVPPGDGMIVPGSNYTLSFWYKQITSGPGYVQEYRVSWLGLNGTEIPAGGGIWQPLPSTVTGSYVQRTLTGLVAPAGALSAFIQITAKTGAAAGQFGKVHIDDVSLVSAEFNSPTVIPSTSIASVEISWPSKTGKSYQVQSSDNLGSWSNFGDVIPGNGSLKAVYDGMAIPKNFYRVGELP